MYAFNRKTNNAHEYGSHPPSYYYYYQSPWNDGPLPDDYYCSQPYYNSADGPYPPFPEIPMTPSRMRDDRLKRNIVRIPVVRSSAPEKSRSELSAMKIQKVWRGYRVRKSVRRIFEIEREVGEMGERIEEKETVEMMRKDEKERLRVNETLMKLLLRLDSVPGVDEGVRVSRKAVTRRVILLQEKVDAIVAGSDGCNEDCNLNSVAVGDTEIRNSGESEKDVALDYVEDGVDQNNGRSGTPTSDGCCDELAEMQSVEDRVECTDCPDPMGEEKALQDDWVLLMGNEKDGDVMAKVYESFESRLGTDQAPDNDDNDNVEREEAGEPNSEHVPETVQPMSQDEQLEGIVLREENKRNRELLEKIMEENEKMMAMMTQLFQKSEKQTQMLNLLANRVDSLEKAFICDLTKRKKKKCLSSPHEKKN